MVVEKNTPLQPWNTFGIAARAQTLVRVRSVADVHAVLADAALAPAPKFVLGGGSNIILTGDVKPVVLKMEIKGLRLVEETAKAWIVEAGAGEVWHDAVAWTLAHGFPGLENLALIPGTVGASPVQNIGAYGVELQDRFESLDAMDLATGRSFSLDAAQCGFGYRDSVFKHAPSESPDGSGLPRGMGLAGRAVITHVRFRLPKPWKPVLGYLDLQRKVAESGIEEPTARQIFDWVCAIRSAKLPDPRVMELDLIRVKGRAQPTRIFTLAETVGAEAAAERLLPAHAAMLEAYRGRRWDEAEAAIGTCRGFAIPGLDHFYATYCSRIAEWRGRPPPDDWDGAYTATEK